MRYIRKLRLKFPDPEMEKQYCQVRDMRVVQDFYMTICFLLVMHTLVVVPSLINDNMADVYIALVPIGILIICIFLQRRFQKMVQYFSLIALFSYNCSRLVSIAYNPYPTQVQARLFFQAYAYGAIQCTVIILVHKIPYKIMGAVVAYILRMIIIAGVVDKRAFDSILVVRHIIIDSFLIYTFYSYERTQRKVFRDYYEKSEELKKFKELLSDSLPQSVTVIDSKTQTMLFSNNCFKKTFDFHKLDTDPSHTDPTFPNIIRGTPEAKSNISSLSVDPSSIREVGALRSSFKIGEFTKGNVALEDIVKRLVDGNHLLDNRVFSLTASYSTQDEHKLFEVTLKGIKWDRVDAVAVILNDITYQEKIISLKVANRTKDGIIATVSHELRTPLHGILGLLETTKKKIEEPEASHYLALCKFNTYLLWSLVNSLLDFHQISTGNLRLNLTRTNVRKVMNEIVKIFQFQANLKKLFLSYSVDDRVPTHITTDKERLKQILVTLVGNAIKFTFEGGVKIEVTQDAEISEYIWISVIDTGVGIKEEDKSKLFKLQVKPDDEGSVRRNGVGIGLTIANHLAATLDGKLDEKVIELRSREGIGSTFSFKILKERDDESFIDQPSPRVEEERELESDVRPRKNTKTSFDIDFLTHRKSKIWKKKKKIPTKKTDKPPRDQTSEDSIPSGFFDESEHLIDIGPKLATYLTSSKQSTQGVRQGHKFPGSPPLHKEEIKSLELSQIKIPNVHRVFREEHETLELPNFEESKLKSNHYLLQTSHQGCILIVDDTPLNLLIAENIFKSAGYPIKTALSGREAIEMVKRCNRENQMIKAILMDCQMPVMDGYETTRILKKMMERNEIQKVPILAWTANNGKEDIERCYESGMVGHLAKPTSKETLIKALINLDPS